MFAQVSKKALLAAACAATVGVGAQAAIIWTGTGADANDVFAEDNYDLTGSTVTDIMVGVATDDDITITGATISTLDIGAGQTQYAMGDGFTLTLDGTSFTIGGNDGFSGVDTADDGATTNTGPASFMNLVNGSSAGATFITLGLTVNIDGTSSMSLRGAGDPINSQGEQVAINMAPGAQLTLASAAEFTEQGADIFVNGVSFADDSSILDIVGTTGTALPEPGSLALLGLGGLLIARRRRA